jgi:hypothetical protein|nr:MAG TPA_asm: head closure knob [Caudoviricetes sp.]
MSLLTDALPSIQALIPNSPVVIKSEVKKLVKGFVQSEISEFETFAHIQPVGNSNTQALANTGLLLGEKSYKFYFTNDLPDILGILDNKETSIVWKGREYSVYSKEDWSQNGWVKVLATLKGENV